MKCTKTVCILRTFALAGVVVMGLSAPASTAVFLAMGEGDTEIGQNQGGFGVFTPGTPQETPTVLVQTGMFPVYNLKGAGANFIKAGDTTRTGTGQA